MCRKIIMPFAKLFPQQSKNYCQISMFFDRVKLSMGHNFFATHKILIIITKTHRSNGTFEGKDENLFSDLLAYTKKCQRMQIQWIWQVHCQLTSSHIKFLQILYLWLQQGYIQNFLSIYMLDSIYFQYVMKDFHVCYFDSVVHLIKSLNRREMLTFNCFSFISLLKYNPQM